MDRGQADIIVADLGREMGISGLALNEEGMAFLVPDGSSSIVAFGYNQAAGTIDLMTCLAEVEPSPARSLAALRGNFGPRAPGGETLAIDPSSGAYVLQRRYFGADLIEGGLTGALQGLLASAGRWTAKLGSTIAFPAPGQPAAVGQPLANDGLRA
jgi:hypothetical protein